MKAFECTPRDALMQELSWKKPFARHAEAKLQEMIKQICDNAAPPLPANSESRERYALSEAQATIEFYENYTKQAWPEIPDRALLEKQFRGLSGLHSRGWGCGPAKVKDGLKSGKLEALECCGLALLLLGQAASLCRSGNTARALALREEVDDLIARADPVVNEIIFRLNRERANAMLCGVLEDFKEFAAADAANKRTRKYLALERKVIEISERRAREFAGLKRPEEASAIVDEASESEEAKAFYSGKRQKKPSFHSAQRWISSYRKDVKKFGRDAAQQLLNVPQAERKPMRQQLLGSSGE